MLLLFITNVAKWHTFLRIDSYLAQVKSDQLKLVSRPLSFWLRILLGNLCSIATRNLVFLDRSLRDHLIFIRLILLRLSKLCLAGILTTVLIVVLRPVELLRLVPE